MKTSAKTSSFYSYAHSQDPFCWEEARVDYLSNTHDCSLGEWGPYNKRFFGISHLPGPEGVRVDWVVVPELHRRRFAIPAALREADYLPWQADPELNSYSYRQQILEKDQLYADITFESDATGVCKINITTVNQTALAHDVRLHLVAGLQPFATGSWSPKQMNAGRILLSQDAQWIDALSYTKAKVGALSGCEGLANDARRQGEVLADGLVDGQGMAWLDDRPKDAQVQYQFPTEKAWQALQLRLISERTEVAVQLIFDEGVEDHTIKSGGLSQLMTLPQGAEGVAIRFPEKEALILDGLVLHAGPESSAQVVFPDWNAAADIEVKDDAVDLSWSALDAGYSIKGSESMRVRALKGDLESCFLLSMHDHVSDVIRGPGTGEQVACILPMVTVPAMGEVTQNYTISGPVPERSRWEKVTDPCPQKLKAGDEFQFGIERLAAVLFTNVVYPVRIKGQNIRHHPPGRWWDSLYTWDCGFIGLGMDEMSPRRALEMLNTYVTEVGDAESAYVHHGSPVPVQFYLYFDLWQKTQDQEMLAFFYPKLKQYLFYLAGLDERSPTRAFDHHILQSWELFYNSGGWDDYPPQDYLRAQPDTRKGICPMVVTSHVAAAAQIMAMAAEALGEDASVWLKLSASMQADMDALAWDEDSGLYGYLAHDAEGNPQGLFHDPVSGESFNQGLDGAMPVLAGGCLPSRAEKIWQALADEDRFLTPLGLSTVDQRAPYYSTEGYWNGAVWVPYQYLFWRGALDAGRGAFARELALRILKTWQRETEEGYACFEHFMVTSGRGAGWHHFGGLSSPILNLFAAYFVPGRLSTGFRTWIVSQTWSTDLDALTCELKVHAVKGEVAPVCLVCLAEGDAWQVSLDGEEVAVTSPWPGLLEIPLKSIAGSQHLCVLRA